MVFERNTSIKVNKVLFDKKAIKINALIGADKLFMALERAITENEYIVVNASMHDYWVEQAIMTFLNRYKIFIESYCTDMDMQHGTTYIKLKSKRKSVSDSGYSELETSYSEDYYLNDCGGYDDFKKSNGKVIDQRLQDVFYLVNPLKDDKILDIGCGRGELTYALASSGADVIGVDYSEAAIKIAQKTYQGINNLKYIREDIFRMEDLDAFDKIVMADVVEHIEQDVLEKIFQKVSRSLNKTGVLVIHTAPNKDYYETVYPELRKQAADIGHYLPENPRSYYEQLMHINEQTPERLRQTLGKFFPYVNVWTGSVEEMNIDKSLEESRKDNQIFAYASNEREALENIMKEIAGGDEKPETDSCKVCIEASDFKVSSDGEEAEYIDVAIENLGKELITSRRKYPIYLAYHILKQNGDLVLFEGERTKITEIIRPGMKKSVKMKVLMSEKLKKNEQYIVRITCVAEGFFWFDATGENKTDILMTVK